MLFLTVEAFWLLAALSITVLMTSLSTSDTYCFMSTGVLAMSILLALETPPWVWYKHSYITFNIANLNFRWKCWLIKCEHVQVHGRNDISLFFCKPVHVDDILTFHFLFDIIDRHVFDGIAINRTLGGVQELMFLNDYFDVSKFFDLEHLVAKLFLMYLN